MDKKDLLKRYMNSVIIGKEEDRSFFVGLEKDVPNLSFRFFSVDEIISMFSYSYSENAVNYLRYAYEFDAFVAEEALLIASLLTKNHYDSPRLNALLPLRDELIKEGLFIKPKCVKEIFANKNILYFNLKTALPISLRLGEVANNMSLSFDIPLNNCFPSDPDIEKYHILTVAEKREVGLYL